LLFRNEEHGCSVLISGKLHCGYILSPGIMVVREALIAGAKAKSHRGGIIMIANAAV
jgi:hypothetical protein